MPPTEPSPAAAEAPKPKHAYGGFPLSALFVFVTVFGILAGMLSPLARHGLQVEILAWAIGCGLGIGLLGLIGGTLATRRWELGLLGGMSGMFLGVFVGPLIDAPVDSMPAIFVASIGGAIAIVAVGVIVRLAERKRDLPPPSSMADATSLSAPRSPD